MEHHAQFSTMDSENCRKMIDLKGYKMNDVLQGVAVVAPMVAQSDLAFRLLCRRYGSELAYTPMLHARNFLTSKTYRDKNFHTLPQDRPLFAQFCGNNPDTIVRAARIIESEIDAVDINFGCPQEIARRGNYGAFLLDNPQSMCEIISTLSKSLNVPVTCKIRKLDGDFQYTVNLSRQLEASGCDIIAIHGRRKDERGSKVKSADWDVIKNVVNSVRIPIIANGGVSSLEDAIKCLEYTGCTGIMVAEAILENPAFFSRNKTRRSDLFMEYLQIIEEFQCRDAENCIKPHAFKMLYPLLKLEGLSYQQLESCTNIGQFREVVKKLEPFSDKFDKQKELRWYYRHGVW
ncbi:tRNA-dihydrouridine(16/17) synthase [NAD(P)(+)]-like [Babesia microti strain RI]|uniref:tRNA-dihydrouridine(16/17) synthase [NAD(P)(+)] n=1 Tax=Babesia microti (strain RI) TaxID=1133968 RepID=A0A1R4AA26_BABMR|nr:tRNA-dihydrouridine(16/17) synthase [NAD(P)(+)]-like [Babesia microti strain RI]SJK85840.1 tRNA-dihydrouridine(16/17) synthase [NAD(P)(+)]-like [Babesia microti strain RI]|eukprot:XP_021338056.1 tRNA-dihydrouridine(16/17) synthase [NAD(P)(+)]-like [Babesia microti strain RI]